MMCLWSLVVPQDFPDQALPRQEAETEQAHSSVDQNENWQQDQVSPRGPRFSAASRRMHALCEMDQNLEHLYELHACLPVVSYQHGSCETGPLMSC